VKLNHKHYSLIDKALSRRSFLAGAGGVAAAAVLAGCSDDGTTTTTTSSSSYTDADILNFALNLEYLEAQFYLYSANGKGLEATDTMAPSGYTGKYTMGSLTLNSATVTAAAVPATATQMQIINEIAAEEENHVRFLRAALGSAAVPMPSIDLTFFTGLGNAITPAVANFSPFTSFNAFLIGAFIFEDVGVTAYLGAAPLISAAGVAAGYLTAASGILAVEAYHAAYIRTVLTAQAATSSTGTAGSSTYLNIANSVEALRAALTVGNSGAPTTSQNTGNSGAAGSSASVEVPLTAPTSLTSLSSIVAADSGSALAFARNVNQVHHIVYGSATVGVAKGGFFPNGTNSIFSTTTA
jgi:hypothetical protein